MAGRSIATVIGSLGGYLVLLGAVVTLVLSWVHSPTLSLAGPWIPFLATALVALLILFTSRPRLIWWQSRRLFNALVLLVLGVLAWLLSEGSLIVDVGAILVVLAGIVLPVEGELLRALGIRRPWYQRLFKSRKRG